MHTEFIYCPQCNNPLERGYMYTERTIKWAETDEPKLTLLGDETLVRNYTFFHKKLPGLRCADCGIVVFQYDPTALT